MNPAKVTAAARERFDRWRLDTNETAFPASTLVRRKQRWRHLHWGLATVSSMSGVVAVLSFCGTENETGREYVSRLLVPGLRRTRVCEASVLRSPRAIGSTLSVVRAIVVHEAGGPEVLRLEEVPDPEPRPGEVLARVEAVGINHADLSRRAGGADTFPTILGYDAAGRRADTGERVLVTGTPGTYAELVAAKEENVFAISDSLETAAAAAIGVPYKTAWWALVDMGGLKKGDTLLVQGAAAATGQASVDIGRSLEAKVYATSRADKLDKVRALGAEALEYGDPKVRELEANVVFEPIGADTFSDSVEALAPEGTLVTQGAVGNPIVSFNVWTLLGKRARIQGIGSAQASRETMMRLISLAGEGKLKPVIDRELPLAQAADAHRAIEARETFGKVILRP
jgi:NADPH2:quinone reductase